MVRKSCDLKDAMQKGLVEIIATSGTTENRLQVLWEWSWWDPQEREAMRLNARVAETMQAQLPRGGADDAGVRRLDLSHRHALAGRSAPSTACSF